MRELDPDDRDAVLGELAPDTGEPGTQASHHLIEHPGIGRSWVTEDGTCGLVIHGKDAWVFGTPQPQVGQHLAVRGFYGTLAGAVSSLDPTPCATDGVRARRKTRGIYVADDVIEHPPPAPGYSARPLEPDDDEAVRAMPGKWVLELWPAPSAAPFAYGLEHEGRLVAIGGPRTLGERYAEIATWAAPTHMGKGALFTVSSVLFEDVLESGLLLTAVITGDNERAQGLARKLGWEKVGEEINLTIGDMRSARRAQRSRRSSRA